MAVGGAKLLCMGVGTARVESQNQKFPPRKCIWAWGWGLLAGLGDLYVMLHFG